MNTIAINENTMKLVGRTHFFQNVLWMIMSGSGVEFNFTGKKLAFTVCGREAAVNVAVPENRPRFAVYINDKRVLDEVLGQAEKTYLVIDEEQEQSVHVKFIKLSECAMSMCGLKSIEADTTNVTASKSKTNKIEFIGDSITCGYGVDDEDPEHHFLTSTEDVTKSFSYKTAKALDVDYSMFSTSGHGIISGYTDDINVKHDDQLIPARYTTLGLCLDTFDGTLETTDIEWDFTRFQPDLIIINLGTNDDSYCQDILERQIEYKEQYVEFLKLVRSKNPSSHILCVLGLMGKRLYPFVCKACEDYVKETGDTDILSFELPEQDGNVGYVADYHPLECFHQQAADELVAFIKEHELLK